MGSEVTCFLDYLVLTLEDKIYQCTFFGLRLSPGSGIFAWRYSRVDPSTVLRPIIGSVEALHLFLLPAN